MIIIIFNLHISKLRSETSYVTWLSNPKVRELLLHGPCFVHVEAEAIRRGGWFWKGVIEKVGIGTRGGEDRQNRREMRDGSHPHRNWGIDESRRRRSTHFEERDRRDLERKI